MFTLFLSSLPLFQIVIQGAEHRFLEYIKRNKINNETNVRLAVRIRSGVHKKKGKKICQSVFR